MNTSIMNCTIASLLLAVSSFTGAVAHEGEDHGTPEPVVSSQGPARISAYGNGTAFDVVLKYAPFAVGETADVTLYVVSMETNRPIDGAIISANLSDGTSSTDVKFAPAAGGPIGAYSASTNVTSPNSISWLFDIETQSDTDLIAVEGFQAKPLEPTSNDAMASAHSPSATPPPVAVFASIATLLMIGAFAAGRVLTQKVATS